MNLKCCWTDTIAIFYLIMYNIYITITIIYVIFWDVQAQAFILIFTITITITECIVGIGIYTLKMADTGNYPRITGGKR